MTEQFGMTTTVTAGRALVDALVAEGITQVYGMPGGHVLGIYDALYDTPSIRTLLVTHEHQAAAMAAAHFQLTGEPAVVVATAGPGVTNLLTAVAEAYIGAIPMIILGGRGPTTTALRGASQEIDTHLVFAPVTKSSVRVDRADLIVPALRQAIAKARNGKPGPVLLDIPRDLPTTLIEQHPYYPVGPPARPAVEAGSVAFVATKLRDAVNPVIVAGGGVIASDASDAVRNLAERLAVPVLTSLAGRGSIPEDHPLAGGGLGAHRNPSSKRLLQEADVVLGLGTRFEEMETNFSPGALPPADALYIQVDLDPGELGRGAPTQYGVVGDIDTFVKQLLDALAPHPAPTSTYVDHPRAKLLQREVAELEAEVAQMTSSTDQLIHPVRVIRSARNIFPRDTTYGVDVGVLAQQIGGAFPYFRVFGPRSTIVPSSFYGMGFVTAAMPAARIAYPDRPALCFTGDGSFQMVFNVLSVATANQLPVTWAVLNDEALGSIRDIQKYLYEGRIVDTDFTYQPDIAALAAACGCYSERVDDPAEVEQSLERALKANQAGQSAVLDFRVAPVRLRQTKEHYFTTYPQEDV